MRTPEDSDALWRDALDDGTNRAFAELSRGQMLAYARRLRRRRKVIGIGATLGVLSAMAYLVGREAAPAPAGEVENRLAGAPPKPDIAEVHFLTDDELLSRFPNRPVALIGSANHQKFVFLDSARSMRLARSQ